jgi:hypothetical protein
MHAASSLQSTHYNKGLDGRPAGLPLYTGIDPLGVSAIVHTSYLFLIDALTNTATVKKFPVTHK